MNEHGRFLESSLARTRKRYVIVYACMFGTFAEGVVLPCLGARAGYHTEVQAITVCPVWVTCWVLL